jgi:chromosome segregation protein
VTLNGQIVFNNQLFIFNTQQTSEKNTGILSFKRELRELAAREEVLQTDFAKANENVVATRDALQLQERKISELQTKIMAAEREHMSLELTARSLQQEIERAERHKRVVEDEKKQISAERSDFENKQLKFESEAIVAQNERTTTNNKLTEIAASLTVARTKAERANSSLSEERARLAAANERRRSLAAALRRVESEQSEVQARAQLRKKEFVEVNSKLENLRRSLAQLESQANSIENERARESEFISAALEHLQAARTEADKSTAELTNANLLASKAKDARAALEVAQAEISTRLENLHELCLQELNQLLPELLSEETKLDFDLPSEKRRVEELREKLESFGAVNLLALEELNETEERLLFLTSQRKDIVDSISAAEDALDEIKRRSRERFKLAFDEINHNFRILFSEIFGGGRGEMNLLDDADILESGIEIVAQPPGKRLQNLLLLSGGEKAMTAIALVLAIFRFRPAPFCLLDEVDAPLDEANVGRFVEKVKQMSEQTQFIVITHNKRTMEAARALYGVTMEEAGISKVVSVKFE